MDELERLLALAKKALDAGVPMAEVNKSIQNRGFPGNFSDLMSKVERDRRAARTAEARAELRKDPNTLGPVEGSILRAVNAATFGMLPKMAGAAATQGGYDPDSIANQISEKSATYGAARPGAAFAADMAGGMIGPPAAIGPARSLLGGVGRGALVGGTYGALHGFGSAPEGEELLGAARGGIGGALLGGPLGGFSRLARGRGAEDALMGAVEKSPGGLPGVSARLKEMSPFGGVLADVSPQLRREAEFAATYGPAVRQEVGDALAARQSGQAERLTETLYPSLKGTPTATERLAQLRSQRVEWAKSPEGFGGLIDVSVPEGLPFMSQPRVRDAVREAQELKLIGTLPGPVPEAGVYTFEQLQLIHRRLDAGARKAFRSGDGDLGNRLVAVRDELQETIDAAAAGKGPEYGAVNARYKQLMDRERALQAGVLTTKRQIDPEEMRRMTATMHPEALAEFKRGLAIGLRQKLQSRRTNFNVAQQIINASAGDAEMLRMVFDNAADLNRFLKHAKIEGQMAQTLREAFRGSATQPRGAMELAAQSGIASGFWGTLGRRGIGAFMGGRRQRAAERMAPYLFGERSLEELLGAAGSRPGQFVGQVAAPMAGGILAGQHQPWEQPY